MTTKIPTKPKILRHFSPQDTLIGEGGGKCFMLKSYIIA